VVFLLAAAWSTVLAQTASLRGVVSDESGALVPGAKVVVSGAGTPKTANTDGAGVYSVGGLAPGNYTVQANAPGLATAEPVRVVLKSGNQTVNLMLHVAARTDAVTVQENGAPALSTDASSNASAVVLRGEDLAALSDDPDDLAADLQALAGPSA